MYKKMSKKNKIITSMILIILTVIVYLMYIYYYYEEITLETFIKHTVGSMNLLGRYIRLLIGKLMTNTTAVNIIVLTPLLIYIGRKIDITEFIKSLRNIEMGPFKAQLEGLKEVQKEHEENVEKIKTEISKDDTKHQKILEKDLQERLENEEKKSKILQLILDNPNIVNVIERFLKNSRKYTIPLNLIGVKYKLETISQLFNYEIKSNSVIIKSINDDIAPLLIDVYTDLKNKGLIYSENF